MKIRNAIIKDTFLGLGHGGFTYSITLDYGGSQQNFGGYGLDGERNIKKLNPDNKDSFGVRAITELLETVGIDRWENLKSTNVRVESDRERIKRVGHIFEDQWFSLSDLATEFEVMKEDRG